MINQIAKSIYSHIPSFRLASLAGKDAPVRFRRAEELFFDPTLPPDLPLTRHLFTRASATAPKGPTLPSMPNGGNTCFIAALTQAFLGGDEKILEMTAHAEKRAFGKEKEALSILNRFLQVHAVCRSLNEPVPSEETSRVRKALSLLGLEGAERPTQQDADEALVALFSAVAEKTNGFQTKLWALDTLGAPQDAPKARLRADERTLDAARRIFWEPSQPNWGRVDLSLPKGKGSLPSMIQTFFFEDKSKEKPRETLRRQDETGRERLFPLQSKRMCLETAPERLTVVFKRFQGARKVDADVQGIGEVLEMPGDYFLDGRQARYRLDGAVFHLGKTPSSGHYTALRRVVSPQGHRHTGSDPKIGRWQGGARHLSQAKPALKEPNLNGLGAGVPDDASSLGWGASGFKCRGCPTQPKPIFESRAVYVQANDSAVSQISQKSFQERLPQAYMLFYKKI